MQNRRLAPLIAALWVAGFFTASVFVGSPARAEAVSIPHDGDTYSLLVARAEQDDQTVDFRALRRAWMDSAARKRRQPTDELRKAMFEAANARRDAEVAAKARAILAQDYTDLYAHKFLRQACAAMGDAACAAHEHFVEFGMLKSIVANGDGQSMATAWEVISIPEEHFVIAMMGAQPQEQALLNGGGRMYDRMDVLDDKGAKHSLYFDITDFFSHELD